MMSKRSNQSAEDLKNCPACQNQELVERKLKNGLVVDLCSQCRGTWLDGDEILRLTRNHEGVRQSLASLKWESQASERDCPSCLKTMIRGEFLGATVTIDYCQYCQGLWFDSQELKDTLQSLTVDYLEAPYPVVAEKLAPSEIDFEQKGFPPRVRGVESIQNTKEPKEDQNELSRLRLGIACYNLAAFLFPILLGWIYIELFLGLGFSYFFTTTGSKVLLGLSVLGTLLLAQSLYRTFRIHYCSICRSFSAKLFSKTTEADWKKWSDGTQGSYRITTRLTQCLVCGQTYIVEDIHTPESGGGGGLGDGGDGGGDGG